jgi:hypothetical protein
VEVADNPEAKWMTSLLLTMTLLKEEFVIEAKRLWPLTNRSRNFKKDTKELAWKSSTLLDAECQVDQLQENQRDEHQPRKVSSHQFLVPLWPLMN